MSCRGFSISGQGGLLEPTTPDPTPKKPTGSGSQSSAPSRDRYLFNIFRNPGSFSQVNDHHDCMCQKERRERKIPGLTTARISSPMFSRDHLFSHQSCELQIRAAKATLIARQSHSKRPSQHDPFTMEPRNIHSWRTESFYLRNYGLFYQCAGHRRSLRVGLLHRTRTVVDLASSVD